MASKRVIESWHTLNVFLFALCITGCGIGHYYEFEPDRQKNLPAGATLSNTGPLRVDVKPVWYLSPGDSGQASLYVDIYNQSGGDISIDDVSIESCRDAPESLRFKVDRIEIIGYYIKNPKSGYDQRPSFARYNEIPSALKLLKPKQNDADFMRLLFEIKGPSYNAVNEGLKSCCVALTVQISTHGNTQTLHPTFWMKRKSHRYPWFLRDG